MVEFLQAQPKAQRCIDHVDQIHATLHTKVGWEEMLLGSFGARQAQLTSSDQQAKDPTKSTRGRALAMLLFAPAGPA